MKALIGAVIVALHAAAFVAWTPSGVELAVTIRAAQTSPRFALAGSVPDAIAPRVETRDDGDGPGLDRKRWSIAYRGGYDREVGASQLVGPFQDPAHVACSGRVIVGQALLDATAPVIASAIDDQLRGQTIPAVGAYRGARDVTARWAQLVMNGDDVRFAGIAGNSPGGGYIRVTATLAFDRVALPIVVALVPELHGDRLDFAIAARASVELDSVVLQWVSDRMGVNGLATRLARQQLDSAIVTALAPPPPYALPGGGELRFVYCGEAPVIRDGAWAALPFGVAIAAAPGGVLPPRQVTAPFPEPRPPPAATLALELDVDAIDAMLFELWRAGYLDRELARAGLDRRFDDDATVIELLTVRISPITLALPPVVAATGARGDELRLAADARTTIRDGDARTIGRLFGALEFRVAPPATALAVDVGGVELACEAPGASAADRVTLVPCYGNLVDAMRGRAGDFHGALTDAFAAILAAVFVDRRLGDPSLPADLVIHGATPSLAHGILHLELDATLDKHR